MTIFPLNNKNTSAQNIVGKPERQNEMPHSLKYKLDRNGSILAI